MESTVQEVLLEIPEQPAPPRRSLGMPGVEPAASRARIKPIDRSQGFLRPVVVDELVGADHQVRAIWDLAGELDLSGFLEKVKSLEGKQGRPVWDPRLLLSVWVYAYSEQVTSAREIEWLMEYEPGLMWLAGLGEVNHHTLSDFRADNAEPLKKLPGDLLGDPVPGRLCEPGAGSARWDQDPGASGKRSLPAGDDLTQGDRQSAGSGGGVGPAKRAG